jgi:hypothetical protein
MALKTIKTDDLDPQTEATHEIVLIIDGKAFKLDLNNKHFGEAQSDLARWVEAAQQVQAKRSSGARGASSGGSITHPNGNNVTKADVRKWVATKSVEWAEANGYMEYLSVVDGKLVMAGPNYVPPVLMRALADEEAAALAPAEQPAQSESAAPAQSEAEQPKPQAPAARKAQQKAPAKA